MSKSSPPLERLGEASALGIEVDSPQPDVGGARTCNGKPDPFSG